MADKDERISRYMKIIANTARKLVRLKKEKQSGALEQREEPPESSEEKEEEEQSGRPTWMKGDCVAVKVGVRDEDAGGSLEGYQGRIEDIDTTEEGKTLLDIRWDSVTLKNTPRSLLEQMEEEGLDWSRYYLYPEDVERAEARDTPEQAYAAADEISTQLLWVGLGEEGRRIQKVLEGVDTEDETAVLDAWERYLRKRIKFPFKARVAEWQEGGEFRQGDQVSVQGFEDISDLYGIVVEVRRGREYYAFPLADLEVAGKKSPNYQPVKDYCIWFANQ